MDGLQNRDEDKCSNIQGEGDKCKKKILRFQGTNKTLNRNESLMFCVSVVEGRVSKDSSDHDAASSIQGLRQAAPFPYK